ncbi:MAG: serine/threonine protein phosphatase [Clostridiales bacterium]|nr:serine/threonine protein phosphatase [Clostridiales bacterium]
MALYVLGDMHLSIGTPDKSMEVFSGWEDYHKLLEKNWLKIVKDEDTVVLAGDTSWAMKIENAEADFGFINKLTGRKIILKGNHDYWWTSMKKMNDFFIKNSFNTLNILHNNHYNYDSYGICGTRGWVNMGEEVADEKIMAREVQRLEESIKSALREELIPIVFLHYPPIYGNSYNYDILEVMYKYKINRCYYGHIHGLGHKKAIIGERDGIKFELISSDFLRFAPKRVL